MSLAAARANLVATLEDTGYPVYGYEEPKINRPLLVIDEAEPLLEYGDLVSRPDIMKVNFEVYAFVTDLRNMKTAVENMDEMVTSAIYNLGEWTLTNLRTHLKVRLKEGSPEVLMSKLSVTNNLSIGDN